MCHHCTPAVTVPSAVSARLSQVCAAGRAGGCMEGEGLSWAASTQPQHTGPAWGCWHLCPRQNPAWQEGEWERNSPSSRRKQAGAGSCDRRELQPAEPTLQQGRRVSKEWQKGNAHSASASPWVSCRIWECGSQAELPKEEGRTLLPLAFVSHQPTLL